MATERKKTGSRSSSSAGRKTSGRSRKRNKKQSTVQEAIGFALIVLGVFSFAAVVIGGAGWLGKGLADVFFGLFGLGAYLVPVLMAGIGWIVLTAGKFRLQGGKLALTGITVLMLFVVNHMFFDAKIQQQLFETKETIGYWDYVIGSYAFGQAEHVSSGALGGLLTFPLRALLGSVGCWILTIALIVGCIFVLGKLSMRQAAQKVNTAAVNTGRRVAESARDAHERSQEMRAQRQQRREEQAQTRMDLDAAGNMPVRDERKPLRNEHVTGPAHPERDETQFNPLTHGEREDELPEEGEIYESPRRTLPRFEIVRRPAAEEEPEDGIEIDHNDPNAGFDADEVIQAPVRPVQPQEEKEYVPLEIVPEIKPVAVEAVEPQHRTEPERNVQPVKFQPIERQHASNPSISDFDDEPEAEEPPQMNPVQTAGAKEKPASDKPGELSPASEVEYQYGEDSTPVIDPEVIPPYRFPPLTLLEQAKAPDPVRDHAQEEEQQRNVELLEETLSSFGIEAKVINVARGPAITRYELQPARGVKVSRITGLADDIALNMAAAGGVRIEAPVPGKSAVGIEIANSAIATVTLREVLESKEFREHSSKLAVALGKDIAGTPVVADLARMPHLLIAGATGSGKSVCINSIIASILYKATPEEVKLILIDPKVVELSVYNGIPHLLIPVVSDPKKAAGALGWAVQEMTDRYKKFEAYSVRDLKGYNKAAVKKGEEPMPQIVVIIDELADLMMVAQNDVETKICRLTQLARAAGIHLVIATQRPSVDVITGLIKANVPSRIAFAVASQVDSRTILGIGGAEKLLGRGDMLFDPSGASKAIRVQGAFISDDEVTDLVSFVKDGGSAKYDEGVIEALERVDAAEKKQKDEDKPDEDSDPLLMDCIELAVDAGQISASMIQRKYRVGYARAGRILDQMEQRGCISGFEGSKPRQTLITREQFYEMAGVETDAPPIDEE